MRIPFTILLQTGYRCLQGFISDRGTGFPGTPAHQEYRNRTPETGIAKQQSRTTSNRTRRNSSHKLIQSLRPAPIRQGRARSCAPIGLKLPVRRVPLSCEEKKALLLPRLFFGRRASRAPWPDQERCSNACCPAALWPLSPALLSPTLSHCRCRAREGNGLGPGNVRFLDSRRIQGTLPEIFEGGHGLCSAQHACRNSHG